MELSALTKALSNSPLLQMFGQTLPVGAQFPALYRSRKKLLLRAVDITGISRRYREASSEIARLFSAGSALISRDLPSYVDGFGVAGVEDQAWTINCNSNNLLNLPGPAGR